MMIIGCDFHTRYQQIAMVDEATGELVERRLDHESGEAHTFYRGLPKPVRVGIEATGPMQWFERLLAELGHELWIGDSAKIRASEVRKQKTDERDALLILDLMLANRFPRIWVPTPAERDLRQLLWHRHKLVCMRTMLGNQLHFLAMSQGLCRKKKLFTEKGRRELAHLSLGPWAGRRREELLRLLDQLDPAIAELDRAVLEEAKHREDAVRLMTHPGIGPVNALAFVLTIGPVTRFRRSKQIASYLGLNPSEHSSGGKRRLGAISKQGNTMVRWLLIEAVHHAVRFDPELRQDYQRLKSRRGHAVAKVAIARKLAVRMYWMLRSGADYARLVRMQGSPGGTLVNASSSAGLISMTTKALGPSANYSLSASVTYTGGSKPAFTATPSGSTLTGGSNPPTVTITYSYDKLNRLTGKTYTDGTPTVTYWYDGTTPTGCSPTLTAAYPIYRRTAMCDTMGWEAWSYNPTGHLTDDRRSTSSLVKDTVYVPNLDGSDASMTYPITSRIITYTPGSAGLPLSASDGTTNYASAAHYAPPGALASLTNNGSIYSTFIYNSRLQPCWNYSTTGTALPWNTTQCNGSTTAGTILDMKYNFNLAAGDNGNVYGITNNRDSTRSQVFTYDSLNRIATAGTVNTSGTNCWGETYGIDAWANLYSLALPSTYSSSCAHENPFSYTMPGNNQLPSSSGFTYDAAGNLMASGTGNYLYNAEHQMTSADVGGVTTTYSYDGDGKRVEKSGGKIYWYGGGSDALVETDLSGNTNNAIFSEYVFFDGKRISRRDYQNNIYYYFADHLGASREMLQSGQTSACYDGDFYPYGGEITPHVNTCQQNYKFTGKERDSESGLDNFGARYNSSAVGRFMSPDPLLSSGQPATPQTWNRYSYALNSPLSVLDPTGLFNWGVLAGGDISDEDLETEANNKNVTKEQRTKAKKALKFRQHFRAAKAGAAAAEGSDALSSGQRAALTSAVNAYGSEGDNNGVSVNLGAGHEATTLLNNDDTISVTLGADLGGDFLTATVAHEGAHVDQAQTWLDNGEGSIGDLSHYEREQAAWAVGASVAQALGMKNLRPWGNATGSQYDVWNKGWRAADIETRRASGIQNILNYMRDTSSDADMRKTYSDEHHQ